MRAKWISVKDELPEIDERVLWYCPSGLIHLFDMDKDMDWQWIEENFRDDVPTHWMPLPEPPTS